MKKINEDRLKTVACGEASPETCMGILAAATLSLSGGFVMISLFSIGVYLGAGCHRY